MGAALDHTRALLTRQLGMPLELVHDVPYREAEGLTGGWLGAFAQPGAILNAATPMRCTLGDGGTAIDEYGESTLAIVKVNGDRIEFHKQYTVGIAPGQFAYVGQLRDGMLAGYWYSLRRQSFSGVFWLARADRLTEATRTTLEARVRSRSIRKYLTLAANMLAPMIAFAGRWATLAVGLGCLAFCFVFVSRTVAMHRAAKLWQRELG